MHDPSLDQRRIRQLETALRVARAQNRRLADDVEWAEEQVRVLRRVIARLVTRKEDTP